MVPTGRRRGFTFVEMAAAMSLTMIVLGVVASMATWNFRERAEQHARHVAIETANNAMEDALATPWSDLTPEWAKSRTLADDPWLPQGTLDVTVTDEPGEKGLKRVVAGVSWMQNAGRSPLRVELVGFFADVTKKEGAK